jgi:cytochrome P450
MWENVSKLGSTDAPFQLLALSRQMNIVNFQLRLPFGKALMIGDPQLARTILQDPSSDKPRFIYKNFEGTSSKTMFTSANDAYMKSLRKSTAHAFSRNQVGRMNQVARSHVTNWMTGRLAECADTGRPFDPAQEFNFITFLVICEAAFEYVASKEEFEAFEHHAEITQKEFIGKSGTNPFRPMLGWFIPQVRRARRSMTALLEFCGHVLDTYRQNNNKSLQNTLIKILNENTSIAHDFQRKSEIKDWLTAGHDTTGYSLANTLTLLAKHPQCQTKLRQELAKLPPDASPEDCDYFRHVIKESMRIMPVAAGGSGRTTGRDVVAANGQTIIPKGSVCFFNQYILNHNSNVYEKADEFWPERWESPSPEMKTAMMPFALGSRNCPGQSLAMAEIHSVLPAILAQYSFELVEEGNPEYFLTLKYRGTKLLAKKL